MRNALGCRRAAAPTSAGAAVDRELFLSVSDARTATLLLHRVRRPQHVATSDRSCRKCGMFDQRCTPPNWVSVAAASAIRADRRTPPASRWDAFVVGCPQATFFHRAGWQRDHRATCSAIARTSSMPSAADASSACCRWRRSRAWLFGHALVSLPFAVYGGVAADDGASATALEDAGAGAGRAAARAAPRAAQRRSAARRTGRRRISTSRSARRSCPTSKPTCSRSRASSARWCARASRTA